MGLESWPSSPRRTSRAAFRCQCSQRTKAFDESYPVKLVVFDFDETLTLITYLLEDGDTEEMQAQIVKTNFQSPWVKGDRVSHLKSMLNDLAVSATGIRRARTVLTKNHAGAKAVLQLLHVAGLAPCFDAIWALQPLGGLYRLDEQWLEMIIAPDMCHKADLLAAVAERPADFLPQVASGDWKDLESLKMEGIVLVDDQRANFQSPSGMQVLRFCKVARYDAYYRNLGYVQNMGGIGAHSFEDFQALKLFVEEPSAHKETFRLQCTQMPMEEASSRCPVELIIFDLDETLTLATFMPSSPDFVDNMAWDAGSQDSEWRADDLLAYNFESPFLRGSRVALLKEMLRELSQKYILAILSRNECGAIAVLNLLRLADVADFFHAIWTMPFSSHRACALFRSGSWERFEPPLEVADQKVDVLHHIVGHAEKWFPQIQREERFQRLRSLQLANVILVDDEREHLQSAEKAAVRYCKVARYDEVYRNCGPLNQLGGIGAHSAEDFETLKAFAAEPWRFAAPSFAREEPAKHEVGVVPGRMPSRSEENAKLPRSLMQRSFSLPALGTIPSRCAMSRSQSFCSSPRMELDVAHDDSVPDLCLIGMED
ncbi:unnamed protein product [Effrenium voratum]|uniref:Uncharacterized protein n=1 Tax=Effrenium voratum TaxID=2562239 RepID=A0AA36HKB5_9DINO|nr:unnamed protein product [Effrenium voratum]